MYRTCKNTHIQWTFQCTCSDSATLLLIQNIYCKHVRSSSLLEWLIIINKHFYYAPVQLIPSGRVSWPCWHLSN